MHVCWGNYEGPHHCDVPFRDIVDLVLAANPSTIVSEAANPRHAHEWRIFEDVKLPDGKLLVPGVIESKSNFIEHPELIAQRLRRYADLVGDENVIAGSDCGYGTWFGQAAMDPDVVWAKLKAMREGAELASLGPSESNPVLADVGEDPSVKRRGRHGPVIRPGLARREGPVGGKLEFLAPPRERQRVALGPEDELVVAGLLGRVQPALGVPDGGTLWHVLPPSGGSPPSHDARGPASVAFMRAIWPTVNMNIASSSV
jgi:hypothetical protein